MKVLIIGGTGFVASNLIPMLLDAGHDVIATHRDVFDDRKKDDRVKWYYYNCVEPEIMNCKLSSSNTKFSDIGRNEKGIDALIYLVMSDDEERPSRIYDTNVASLYHWLEFAKHKYIKNFIYTSTASVYGWRKEVIGLDLTKGFDPMNLYATTKLMGEYLVKSYQEYFPIHILRLNTVYGYNQKKGLILNLAKRIKKGLPIVCGGNFEPILSPIYVDDVCKLIMQSLNSHSSIVADVGGEPHSILDMAEDINRILFDMKPMPIKLDKSKNEKNIITNMGIENFEPITFDEGIEKIKEKGGLKWI